MNFGPTPKFKRFIMDNDKKKLIGPCSDISVKPSAKTGDKILGIAANKSVQSVEIGVKPLAGGGK